MHSLQYNKKIVSNNQNFHPGIARANTINMHSRMTEYPNGTWRTHRLLWCLMLKLLSRLGLPSSD